MRHSSVILSAFLFGCSEYNVQGHIEDVEPPFTTTTTTTTEIPVAVAGFGLEIKRDEVFALDGTASYDPDALHANLSYAWSVEGADSKKYQFEGADTEAPLFSSSELGVYSFSLTVTDPDGNVSENIAMTTVEVVPWEDLVVEVSWPKNVDLDLHVIRDGNDYYSTGDCYYGNPEPDWGVAGDLTDNPVLSDDGEGSKSIERIELSHPEEAIYTVMVHYFNDYNVAASPSTIFDIAIYAEGNLIQEFKGQMLYEEGHVMNVGTINWPNLEWSDTLELTSHEGLGGPDVNESKE